MPLSNLWKGTAPSLIGQHVANAPRLSTNSSARAQMRARTVADAVVVAIMRSQGDHFAKTRKHIVSLGLTLPRLAQPPPQLCDEHVSRGLPLMSTVDVTVPAYET